MKPISRIVSCGLLLLAGAFAVRAQTRPPLAFEVASIKPNNSNDGVSGGCHGVDSLFTPGQVNAAPPLGRCRIRSARLSHMIGIAYKGVTMDLIKSGPDWIARGDERFDVDAKAEEPTKATEQQLLEMLQNLLIERFQLKFHKEPFETPGFALMVGKNGPKLETTRSQDPVLDSNFKSAGKGEPHLLRLRKCSMERLAQLITLMGNHGPIVDHTELKGEYDLSLTWDDETGPTLVSALSRLGLRLEPQKVQQARFVIDSAERPSVN
jgi:uncharacterized protein (TIGR03435 family)